MNIEGTIWIVKGSIPLWSLNKIGYIIKIARIKMGSMILVIQHSRNNSSFLDVVYNGCEGCIFYSDLESFCSRIY